MILSVIFTDVYAVKSNCLSPLSNVKDINPESISKVTVLKEQNMLLNGGYLFPRWLYKKLNSFLYNQFIEVLSRKKKETDDQKYEDIFLFAKKIANYLTNRGGVAFSGDVSEVPKEMRSILKPHHYEGSLVLSSFATQLMASFYKDLFDRYNNVSLFDVEMEINDVFYLYHQIINILNSNKLGQDIFFSMYQYFMEMDKSQHFSDFISSIRNQYASSNSNLNDVDVLNIFIANLLTDVAFFNSIPRGLTDIGYKKEPVEIEAVFLEQVYELLSKSGSIKEVKGCKEALSKLKKMIHGQNFREQLFLKVKDLFSGYKYVISSSEQEYDFYSRIRRALKKYLAIQKVRSFDFQDEYRFLRENKAAINRESFLKIISLYQHFSIDNPNVIPFVLAFMDIAKLSDFQNKAEFAHLNFSNHPEAGAEMIKILHLGESLNLSTKEIEQALMLIKYHGFIGQSKRGEVTDSVFVPIVDYAIKEKNISIIDAYAIINLIDVSLVNETLLDQDMFEWFMTKILFLKNIVIKGIKENKSANVLFDETVKDKQHDSYIYKRVKAIERLKSIFPDLNDMDISVSLQKMFSENKEDELLFINWLSLSKGGFSLWYPESALIKLSIQARLKLLFLSFYYASYSLKEKKDDEPIDINFYSIAEQLNRTDETRLAKEAQVYLESLMMDISIKGIKSFEFLEILKRGGLDFHQDQKSSAFTFLFDSLAVISLEKKTLKNDVDYFNTKVSSTPSNQPIIFFEKNASLMNSSKIAVMVDSFAPVNKRQRALISNARKRFGIDHVVLILPKNNNDGFEASLAERALLMKYEFNDKNDVSIAIADQDDFVSITGDLRNIVGSSPEIYAITNSTDFENFCEEERSLISKEKLDAFFRGNNKLAVALMGYFGEKGISRVVAEKHLSDSIKDNIFPLALNKSLRFASTTEARRIIRNNLTENSFISKRVLRIIKELDLFATDKNDVFDDQQAVKVVFINLTSPNHKVLTEPLGINALVGDLRYAYGKKVNVSVLDTQFGMDSEDLMSRLELLEPDVIAFSAQLESHNRLYEELNSLKKMKWFRRKKSDVFVGHNLVTNAHKEVLSKFPWVIAVLGEGELAMRAAVKYRQGEISLRDIPAAVYSLNGMIVQNDGVPVDAGNLNIPARDILAKIVKRGADVEMETSRGCGHGVCSFCKKDPFRAHFWQPLPDHVVLNSYEQLLASPDYVRQVSFSDPEFLGGGKAEEVGRKRAQRLFQGIIELNDKYHRKMNIATSIRADSVFKDSSRLKDKLDKIIDERQVKLALSKENGENIQSLLMDLDKQISRIKKQIEKIDEDNIDRIKTLKLAKDAGVDSWFVGIESGSDEQLLRYRKGVTVAENERCLQILKDMGFRVMYGFIPLDPFASSDDLIKDADFIDRTDSYLEVSFPVNQLKVQSNTPYYDFSLQEGILGGIGHNLHTFESVYKNKDVQDIADLISRYSREIGDVFYIIKYLYRTKMLNNVIGEEEERGVLRKFFYDYNKLEVDYMKQLAQATQKPELRAKLFADITSDFRNKRLDMICQIDNLSEKNIIRDENKTLKPSIDKIRSLLDQYQNGQLELIPPLTRTRISKFRRFPHLHIRKLMHHPEFLTSKELQEEFFVLANRMRYENNLIKLEKVPVIKPIQGIQLYRKISDDLSRISFYEVLSDKGVFVEGKIPDYSKLKLKPIIEDFPSYGLGFPLRALFESDSEIAERLNGMMSRGNYYTECRGVISNYDDKVDLNVWSWNGDTGNIDRVWTDPKNNLINNPNIKKAYELGCGGGHTTLKAVSKLPNLKWIGFSDINPYALMCTMRQVKPVAAQRDIETSVYLGKGLIPDVVDLLFINPPYIPEAPWESKNITGVEDPYKGTGVIKEIVEKGLKHLNPENPDACIIMNYSNLAEDDFQEYLRAYGQLVEVEILDEGYDVPLKIYKEEEWFKWMKTKGLIERNPVDNGGYKYWHKLNVVRLKPKKVSLQYKNGVVIQKILHDDLLSRDNFKKLNFQALNKRSKLLIISYLNLSRMPWFDKEFLSLFDLYEYYRDEILPPFEVALEKQLSRKVHISTENLLRELFSEKYFMNRNIIGEIYFSGLNPNLSSSVRQLHRSAINNASDHIQLIILDLFQEYFIEFGWDQDLKQYLADQYDYQKDFKIVNIRDYSYGNGVYALKVFLEEKKQTVDIFIKREHKNDGLENERPFLELQKDILGVSKNGLPVLPARYKGKDGKYGIMFSPKITGESLDVTLTLLQNMDLSTQKRIKEDDLLTDLETYAGTPKYIQSALNMAEIKISKSDRALREEGLKIIEQHKHYIKRNLTLKGNVDFHTHTIYSDGKLSPQEIVLRAWLNGATAIAITDHMTMAGVLEAFQTAESLGDIQIIPGVEIYTDEKQLGLAIFHSVVCFPDIQTSGQFKKLYQSLQSDSELGFPLISDRQDLLSNSAENIRISFNRLHKKENIQIENEKDVKQPSIIQYAKYLKKTYPFQFKGMSASQIRKELLNPLKSMRYFSASTKVPFNEVMEFAAKSGGIVFPAHVLSYRFQRDKQEQLKLMKELIKKYAVVEFDGKKYMPLRGIGAIGSKNSSEDDQIIFDMVNKLEEESPALKLFPLIKVNESDFHDENRGALFYGSKTKDGNYSVSPDIFSFVKLIDLRRQQEMIKKNGAEEILNNKMHFTPFKQELESLIVLSGASHTALSGIMAVNDARLSNFRIDIDQYSGELKHLTRFDVAFMLNEDENSNISRDKWFQNYDWALEDIKQGVSEMGLLMLSGKFLPRSEVNVGELKSQIELLKEWKKQYQEIWGEFIAVDGVKLAEKIFNQHLSEQQLRKKEMLAVLTERLKEGMEQYLEDSLFAFLDDYQKRVFYRTVLDRLKKEKGSAILGDLAIYTSPPANEFKSSHLECFRGFLSKDFIERRNIKNGKSFEDVMEKINYLVKIHLGEDVFGDIMKTIDQLETNALIIMEILFSENQVSQDQTIIDAYFGDLKRSA